MKLWFHWVCSTVVVGAISVATPLVSAALEPNASSRGSHYVIKEAQMRGLLPTDRKTFTGPRWGAGKILAEGHKIEPGKYFVIRIQTYDNPEGDYEDRGQFEKLTLEVRNYHGSGTYQLPSDDVRGFYSKGSQTWGLGDYSEGLQGTIQIEASGPSEVGPHVPEWRVAVELTAQLVDAHDATKRTSKQIKGSYHCPIVKLEKNRAGSQI